MFRQRASPPPSPAPVRVRLKDIAERAKVSLMTVSKVLRDEPDISKATKARIRDIAQQMGYVPDSAAQSLRNTRTRLLGVVLPSSALPPWSRILTGIEEGSHALGYDVLVGHSLNQMDREEAIIRRFLSRRVDGLLIAPVYRLVANAPIYDFILKRSTPAVILGQRALFCAGFANVESEDIAASQKGTRHLLELGHRRIAFFTGPVVSPLSQERFEGYRRAMREAALPIDDKLIYNAGTTVEDGEAAALQFLHERCDATAIQAFNDFVAIGAASQLARQGIEVPGAVSILGFGNVFLSDRLKVPLSTIHQPKFSLGAAALEMLLKSIEGATPENKRLPCELVLRASTAPPRTSAGHHAAG